MNGIATSSVGWRLKALPERLALVLGLSQFSDTLGQRFLGRNRRLGRIYVGAVAVAAPVGASIEYIKHVHTIAPLRLAIGSPGERCLLSLPQGPS